MARKRVVGFSKLKSARSRIRKKFPCRGRKKFLDKVREGLERAAAERGTPTEVIRRAPHNVERAWAKKPRIGLFRISGGASEKRGRVNTRKLRKGESMVVHTHVPIGKSGADPLPSVSDLTNVFRDRKIIKTGVVASKARPKNDVSEVAGYTFFKRKKGTKAFLNQWRLGISDSSKLKSLKIRAPAFDEHARKMAKGEYINKDGTLNTKLFEKGFRAAQQEIERAGYKLRFVPNKNAGYIWNGTRFVKK